MDINRFKANILLKGDFHIDLLKINERPDFYDYLLTILSHGLLPIIIFPTRLAQNSASLIDNIFSNLSTVMYHSSGILLSDISDHLPYYFSINYDITNEVRTKRIPKIRKFNEQNFKKIFKEIEAIDITITITITIFIIANTGICFADNTVQSNK